MSGPTPNQDIFDVRRVRRLVELMKEHDLSEIDIREGETRIKLRRGADPVVTVAPVPPRRPLSHRRRQCRPPPRTCPRPTRPTSP